MALKKVINSATQQFEPVLVDKLVLDAVPTVNSFNSVTSDAVARAVAGASGEVPQVTESDNGKVLKAVYDAGGAAVEWGEAAPAVTVDQTYNALSANPQSGVAVAEAIAAIPAPSVDEVPDVTSSDDGKVLTASYSGGSGSYSWQTAQGGGGGASVEAGAGLVKSGDTLSVNVDDTIKYGSITYTTGTGWEFRINNATQLSNSHSIEFSQVPNKYSSGSDTPTAYMYLLNAGVYSSPTIRARYTAKTFSTYRNSSTIYMDVTASLPIKVNLIESNFTMLDGSWSSLVSSTMYIAFGFEDGQGNVTYFENVYGSVKNNDKLNVAIGFPQVSKDGYLPLCFQSQYASGITWMSSIYRPIYEMGSAVPTFSVNANTITIQASNNSKLTNTYNGLVRDGNYIKKKVLNSIGISLGASSTSPVNVSVKYTFGSNSFTFTGRTIASGAYAYFAMEHPLYFTASADLTSIEYTFTDDNGNPVSLWTSSQLSSFALSTMRLP